MFLFLKFFLQNTYTNLNADLIKFDQIVLNSKTKNILEASVKKIMETYSNKYLLEFEEGFNFPRKYRDWYEGFALRQFPFFLNDGQYNYRFDTSATSGRFNSFTLDDEYKTLYKKYENGKGRLWFKEFIDEHYERYNNVWYQLNIEKPDNSQIKVKTKFDTLEITNKYGLGGDTSSFWMHNNNKISYGSYSNIGPNEMETTLDTDVTIDYHHTISESVLSQWGRKRVLGMDVTWEMISLTGQVNPTPKYVTEISNVVFRKLVNMLQEGIESKVAWDVVEKIRIDWLTENNYLSTVSLASVCSSSNSILSEEFQEIFLNKVIAKINLKGVNLEKIHNNVKESNFKLASEIQYYLTSCPSKEWIEKIKFLNSLISTASPRMLLATTNKLIVKARELGKEFEAEAFTQFLNKITQVFKLKHKDIEIFIKKGIKRSEIGK